MTFVRHPMFVIWHSSDEPHQVTQSGALLPQNSKVPDNLRISVEMSFINLITSVERWWDSELQAFSITLFMAVWQMSLLLLVCLFLQNTALKSSQIKKICNSALAIPCIKNTHTIPPAIVLDRQSGFRLFFGYSAHMCIYLKMYEKKTFGVFLRIDLNLEGNVSITLCIQEGKWQIFMC